MPAKIRKIIVQTDEVRVEMGRDVQPPVRKALAMAVIENPCAGRYVENLDELIAIGEELGGLSTAIDVPLGHKDAAYVRSHFDAMEARVADAPRANEIVVAVVVTDSGRPLPRVGGLTASEIKGVDGLR